MQAGGYLESYLYDAQKSAYKSYIHEKQQIDQTVQL